MMALTKNATKSHTHARLGAIVLLASLSLFYVVAAFRAASAIVGDFPATVLAQVEPVPTITVPGNNSRTFTETGKTVSGLFLDYWNNNGGLAQQGFPISDVITEVSELDGQMYTVQYFERSVFEYHPEIASPHNVLLSQLGTFQYKQKYPDGTPNQTPDIGQGSVLFEQTGHRLGGVFYDYWVEHGGLAQQGYPISDPFWEKSSLDGQMYIVQYFERAVFEYHQEHAGTPYEVLLSQLGTFRHKQKYEQNQEMENRDPIKGEGWKIVNHKKSRAYLAPELDTTGANYADDLLSDKIINLLVAEDLADAQKLAEANSMDPNASNFVQLNLQTDRGLVKFVHIWRKPGDTSTGPAIFFFDSTDKIDGLTDEDMEGAAQTLIMNGLRRAIGGDGYEKLLAKGETDERVLALLQGFTLRRNNTQGNRDVIAGEGWRVSNHKKALLKAFPGDLEGANLIDDIVTKGTVAEINIAENLADAQALAVQFGMDPNIANFRPMHVKGPEGLIRIGYVWENEGTPNGPAIIYFDSTTQLDKLSQRELTFAAATILTNGLVRAVGIDKVMEATQKPEATRIFNSFRVEKNY